MGWMHRFVDRHPLFALFAFPVAFLILAAAYAYQRDYLESCFCAIVALCSLRR